MKIWIIAALITSLVSCSGYFTDESSIIEGEMNPLSLTGGGYLSSDVANDISPCLFRDQKTDKVYLFFSSDRDGSFDIYYSMMDADGTFHAPVKMISNINTTEQEITPVVFQRYAPYYGVTNIFLTYLRVNPTNTTIITYRMNEDFTLNDYQSQVYSGATNLSLVQNSNIFLYICDGTTTLSMTYFNNVSAGIFWNALITNMTGYFSYPVRACTALYSGTSGQQFYLIQSLTDQLSGMALNTNTMNKQYFSISDYASIYHDGWPFVDVPGGFKVYYASDRYGRGNYDLYRYNKKTFNRYLP